MAGMNLLKIFDSREEKQNGGRLHFEHRASMDFILSLKRADYGGNPFRDRFISRGLIIRQFIYL
jgi:hypothetical protein